VGETNYEISDPKNSFLLYYEIKNTGRIVEGIVPFSPYHPCAERDADGLPVQE
jgi:hypothetical protein